jgi:hypothetical protein
VWGANKVKYSSALALMNSTYNNLRSNINAVHPICRTVVSRFDGSGALLDGQQRRPCPSSLDARIRESDHEYAHCDVMNRLSNSSWNCRTVSLVAFD